MERYIELVKQYPGQEQVDLAVEIEVPGSWFGVGSMGSLTTSERREKYNASGRFQGGAQDKGEGHPLHLPRGLVTLNKKTHTVSALESPVYPQKSPMYPHKSPIYPQKSPFFPQKSPIYPQKSRTLSRTGLLQRRR